MIGDEGVDHPFRTPIGRPRALEAVPLASLEGDFDQQTGVPISDANSSSGRLPAGNWGILSTERYRLEVQTARTIVGTSHA